MLCRGLCPNQGPHATLVYIIAAASFLTWVKFSESILCGPCNPLLCDELVDCPKGITTDPCGCCDVCSKLVNETCGGKHGLLGRCARGLECFISPEIGQPITGHEEGVCKEVGQSNCANVNCEEEPVSQCPTDSILIRNMSLRIAHSCCKPPLACECNWSACVKRACPAGYKSALVVEGLGKPGRCCDQFRCERLEKCRSVVCPVEVELACEDDSYRPPNVASDDGCCSIAQGCRCKPNHCPEVKCPAPLRIEVISKATNEPGSCCDEFRCVNESQQSCEYKNREYADGEEWRLDKCTTCMCRNGLTFCNAEACNTSLCVYNLVPEGECCPVCKGCVSDTGLLYNNSEVWKQGNCVTCRCDAGKPLCQAELCALRCQKPRYIPGQCCPICDGEASVVTQPAHCPDMSNCSAVCPAGLQRNATGCYICKCKPENCDLECKYGYVVEETGEEVCECTKPPHHCSRLDSCKKYCVYGYKRARTGCLRCRCNKCPPFNCTKRCLHGYLTNDQSCTICKCKEAPLVFGNRQANRVTNAPALTTVSPHHTEEDDQSCLSSTGRRHDDGESWHDGCRRCYCHNGKEMCSLITCPSPRCTSPVFRVGDCCPTCPDVSIPAIAGTGEQERCVAVSGNHYAEGETWQLDECTQCICHDGGVLCETQTCPPLLCRFPIKHKDRCCPVCPGGADIATELTPGLGTCTSPAGTVYNHGNVWQPSPCQGCVCKRGQVHCFSQTCPPAPCDKPVLMKGQCCPNCLEGKVNGLCTRHSVQFSDGEQWQEDNCTVCQCDEGEVTCHRAVCPVLHCTILVKQPTECCPVCLNNTTYTFPAREDGLIPPLTNQHPDQLDPDKTEGPVEKSPEKKNYLVATAVLAIIVFIFLFLIVVLVYVVMRQRRTGTFKTNMDRNMLTDIKIRPKSTNLDLQGAMPVLYDQTIQSKSMNYEKIPSEVTPLTSNNDVLVKPVEEQEKSLLPAEEDDVIWSKLACVAEIPNKHLYESYDKV